MKIRKLIKYLLLFFVVVSFGLLVYKEFSPKNESKATNIVETRGEKTTVSVESVPAPKSRPLKEPATKQKEEAPSPHTAVKSQNSKLIAYYFHGTFRCTTCRTIEQYSHDAIQMYFAKELGNGRLEFRPVNIEEPENKHFIQDYQLVTRSLVLSLMSDGKETKWNNLADVWKLVRDKDKFFQYVKDEVEKFLKET
ncbi:MAG: nitrophenyl compound nitroreductase subunit ArsF family protein [Nitrospirota bacterium]|nr:nitrophenyl compound nitroreductase subunit ArsF family protein [Nitrospirota bacterium]